MTVRHIRGKAPGAVAQAGPTATPEDVSAELSPRLRTLGAQPATVQNEQGYQHTLREICQQPSTWLGTARQMVRLEPELTAFLERAGIAAPSGAIVLTGSGSSLYAAASVAPALQKALRVPVHVASAGELLMHPETALPPTRPCVVLSFGRSGNSPESTGLVDLLLAGEPDCRHVALTCCASGGLATRYREDPRVLTLLLDERTCDRSLVMTSSFTNMVVAAHAIGFRRDPDAYLAWTDRLAQAVGIVLSSHADALADVVQRGIPSAVFLGSGCRYAGAREASLKLTEMSDGRVLAFAETYLGVRHGPMTAIRDATLVVCFVSSDPRTRAYEADLIGEISRKRLGAAKILIGENVPRAMALEGDVVLDCPGMAALGDDGALLIDVVASQLLAFFHSLHLGLRPDAPSAAGVINRVVQPFRLYGGDRDTI